MDTFNIETICEKYKVRKGNIKRMIQNMGFTLNTDYFISKPNRFNKTYGGQNKENVMVTKQVFDQLDYKYAMVSRNMNACFDIKLEYVKRYMPKETEILGFIYEALSPLFDVRKQYKVDSYYIDMYIVDTKLAIECDEHNHDERDPLYEQKRQDQIQQTLTCKFIRFNPDDKSFRLAELMSIILQECFINM
jgi:very-short-patch-repair endonuclease